MRIEERLGLANLAYRRAVVRAQAEASPTAWRGLVTAAKNLRTARRDREGRSARGVAFAAPQPDGRLVLLSWPPAPLAVFDERWSEFFRERDRAHALMTQARELVQDCQLRAELAALSGLWRQALERRAPR